MCHKNVGHTRIFIQPFLHLKVLQRRSFTAAQATYQSQSEHDNASVGRQRETPCHFLFVESKGIAVEVKGPIVPLAAASETIRRDEYIRLAAEILWCVPIAEALRKVGRRTVGIGHPKNLRLLIAIHAYRQHLQAIESSCR
jgi:hypothetical protein